MFDPRRITTTMYVDDDTISLGLKFEVDVLCRHIELNEFVEPPYEVFVGPISIQI